MSKFPTFTVVAYEDDSSSPDTVSVSFSTFQEALSWAESETTGVMMHYRPFIEIRISEDYKYLVDLHKAIFSPMLPASN